MFTEDKDARKILQIIPALGWKIIFHAADKTNPSGFDYHYERVIAWGLTEDGDILPLTLRGKPYCSYGLLDEEYGDIYVPVGQRFDTEESFLEDLKDFYRAMDNVCQK